jgi:predicted  nucleic acid-binding Zn-ribbon protein
MIDESSIWSSLLVEFEKAKQTHSSLERRVNNVNAPIDKLTKRQTETPDSGISTTTADKLTEIHHTCRIKIDEQRNIIKKILEFCKSFLDLDPLVDLRSDLDRLLDLHLF